MKSVVKWFDDVKGFGFIEYNDDEDIFVHYSAIQGEGHKTLIQGEIVEFEIAKTASGLRAKNVQSISRL